MIPTTAPGESTLSQGDQNYLAEARAAAEKFAAASSSSATRPTPFGA
jgi:hypothetical protein